MGTKNRASKAQGEKRPEVIRSDALMSASAIAAAKVLRAGHFIFDTMQQRHGLVLDVVQGEAIYLCTGGVNESDLGEVGMLMNGADCMTLMHPSRGNEVRKWLTRAVPAVHQAKMMPGMRVWANPYGWTGPEHGTIVAVSEFGCWVRFDKVRSHDGGQPDVMPCVWEKVHLPVVATEPEEAA